MFVIGLILLVARLLRRHGSPFQQGIPAEALEILGRRLIDPRHSVYLLRVGPRVLVVGLSPGGLQALGEISDPVEVDLLAGLCRDGSKNSGFGSVFRNLIQGQIQSENRQGSGQRPNPDDTETGSRSPMRPPLSSTHRASLTSSSTPEDELTRRLRGERKSRSDAAMGGADG
jgi:flagellar biogenesis protein FliO